MFDTLGSVALAVGFVLPGFVLADLAESRRATRPARTDLELALRSLVYALLLQGVAALTGWTGSIATDLTSGRGWTDHLTALALYAVVVGVAVPTALGLTLSSWLRRAEQAGQLEWWHYALGARDYREAWDYVFGKREGTYLLFTVAGDDGPRHLLAKYGTRSWASQAPTRPQEIFVENVWPADSDGMVEEADLQRVPPRGMWISTEKIERLEVLDIAQI